MTMGDRLTIIGTGIAVVTVLSMQINGVNIRIDDLRADVANLRLELRADVAALDERLREVEVAFGKVDQRLATLERLHLPSE